MHEILRQLAPGARVLDLGCSSGSFPKDATPASVVRLDRDLRLRANGESMVRADAAALPFSDRSFEAIVSNHSLEHLDDFRSALREIGRVLKTGGALFVSVPDASTVSDRLYRWLARGGGHVNAFTSAANLAKIIEDETGLRHVATRTLCSSLAFLNRRNVPGSRPRRKILVGAGYEWSLFLYVWASRRLDRMFRMRTGVYGWAFYFGDVREEVDTVTSVNVCIRCGSGTRSFLLQQGLAVRSLMPGIRIYRCPNCGATNPFADDGDAAVRFVTPLRD